jgi:acyl-CoA thioester hydrolase
MAKIFNFQTKVYYDDTDAGGIVYYANYLKFFERARTELIYHLGLNHQKLMESFGFQIVVSHCDIAFKKPAKFEDHLLVETIIHNLSPVRIVMNQNIFNLESIANDQKGDLLIQGKVKLASINKESRPIKMPKEVFALFKSCL